MPPSPLRARACASICAGRLPPAHLLAAAALDGRAAADGRPPQLPLCHLRPVRAALVRRADRLRPLPGARPRPGATVRGAPMHRVQPAATEWQRQAAYR